MLDEDCLDAYLIFVAFFQAARSLHCSVPASNRAQRLHEGRWDELSCRNMTVYQACENNDGITFDDKIEIVGEHGVTM
jgi:hypothetical protein